MIVFSKIRSIKTYTAYAVGLTAENSKWNLIVHTGRILTGSDIDIHVYNDGKKMFIKLDLFKSTSNTNSNNNLKK